MNTETSPHWSITGSANCLPIGTRLAEFEITGVVGEGGFGNVYLAFDHSLQRTVAIKEYMPVALASRGADGAVLVQTKRHKETFETGMNSFINEARLLAQFDHPALIKVYRFWEQNNTAYMAMRYYEGQTFKNIVAKHPEIVTEAWLKPILKPILEALEVLYKIQILHRDISPDNIMIQTNGEAVLLDFGAARQILSGMSQALTVILKPGYAPVEQYAEDSDMQQGPWTDIYALSAVVYSAIVKKAPPTSVTRLLKDPIELLQNSPQRGFSKEFLSAIDKGMAVQPHDRPQSIAEFSKLLGIDAIGSEPPAALPAAKSSTTQKKADATSKTSDSRDNQRSRSTSSGKSSFAPKTGHEPASKVSNKVSWILVVAGVLAAGTGIYRMSHRDIEPKAIVDSGQAATVSSSPGESGATPTAVATEVNSASAMPPPVVESSAAPKEPLDQATPGSGEKTALPKHAATIAHADGASMPAPTAKTLPPTASASGQSAAGAVQTDETASKTVVVYRLTIRPWATVFVDGNMKGVSPPLKRLLLPEGKHQIKLINPNFPDHTVDILVNNNKRFGVIDYEFTSR